MGTYNGNEPYVFVSYCHADSEQVLPIIEGLQNRGFRVWYDEGIEVGIAWAKYVGERLEQCGCVLAYVTKNFDDSHNCWQELDFAMEEKKRIVAIKADGGRRLSAGMRMRLGSLQAMPFEKYGSVEKILDTLSQAVVLKPCLGAAAMSASAPAPAPAKLAEPSPEELFDQAWELSEKNEAEKAFLLYKKAAELGYAPAQNNLGWCYYHGNGVQRNIEESIKWYRKSADLGYAAAQNNTGFFYQFGDGVPQDQEEAVKWYRKAADQGDAAAQFNLGYCYSHGEGMRRNKEEAAKWYRKAAEQGHMEAQYNLGICYRNGIGVQKNIAEARKWLQKAADQGLLGAVEALKNL